MTARGAPGPTDTRRALRLFGTVTRPLQAFLALEAASGILLLVCAVAAFVWANLDAASYRAIFEHRLALGSGGTLAEFTLRSLINDALMAIFFFVVGMEIKRELVVGELSTPSKAALPAIAALGGMAVPAAIFLAFNQGGPGQNGWGIPMATDIAFCVGVLTLLGNRVPRSLVVFITALAIFDDIGGILVIALFYGHGLHLAWLAGAAALTFVLLGMASSYVRSGVVYALVGAALWYALHHGGIHAAIAGVVLGLAIPARARRPSREVLRELASHLRDVERGSPDVELDAAQILMIEERLEELQAPLGRFVHALHPYVAFGIMPLFALANSGVTLGTTGWSGLAEPVALGTALGLLLGKPVGIAGLTLFAVRAGIAPMPAGASARKVIGAAIVAGIGFTVALFIAGLAFPEAPALLDQAKLGILIGSLAAGVCGFALLRTGR